MGGGELDGVDEVRQRAAADGLRQVIAAGERDIELAGGGIEPSLHARFQRREELFGAGQRSMTGRKDLASDLLAAVLADGDGHAAGMRCAIAGLDEMAVAKARAVHAHMLMAGEHEVKIQLRADAAGFVFVAVGEPLSGCKITFEAAVVDHHRHIAQGLDGLERARRRGHGLLDDELGGRLRVFPAGDIVRARADQAHAQAVFQLMHGIGCDGQLSLFVADVTAQAQRVQIVQIIGERVEAAVEIVVAERHEMIAREVHHRGDGMRAVLILRQALRLFFVCQAVIEVGQRRALDRIAAVDDERVAVVRIFGGKAHQTHRAGLRVGVVGGVEIAVGIGGKADGKRLVHDELL